MDLAPMFTGVLSVRLQYHPRYDNHQIAQLLVDISTIASLQLITPSAAYTYKWHIYARIIGPRESGVTRQEPSLRFPNIDALGRSSY